MTGVIDIGLQSDGSDGVGLETFAMGRINADFHCLGTNEDDSDRFRMSANGAAKNGASVRKTKPECYPAMSRSRPKSIYRILNILISLMCVYASTLHTVLFAVDASASIGSPGFVTK